ncbi:Maf family protein [Klugiella xanthotipulae]|uniref:Nucleoside triphosphate pyrophosphatase n=1 Tax=Klugiella xanthotipulae TaxID=244735 RepID=A0A543HYR6_9MICO|nr:nucleoside triphosphate pyrophosphatase [Klugiella xanthotipulae]TQM63430.1 septum formation protein [Klugiella xanthotipulae]
MSHSFSPKGTSVRFYLASTSPARLMLLRSAGIEPTLLPSHVDEEATATTHTAELGRDLTPAELVQLLARAKAEAVVTSKTVSTRSGETIDGLVLGGDSAFVLDEIIYGKPHEPAVARERWLAQRGRTGTLYSGHWLIDHSGGTVRGAVGAVTRAEVTFSSDITAAEIDAYIATGEPLQVAGAFTIDSLGAPFVDGISGDPSTVVGMSLPALRRLVRELGHEWTSLWTSP